MQFTCPTCNATLALPDDSVGRKAQCPSCQAVFRVSDPLVLPDQSLMDDRSTAADRASATTQLASIKPERTDAVGCPGCDKLLAFNASSAGQIVICPSCQRRIRMPTAAEMHVGLGYDGQAKSTTSVSQLPSGRESTTYAGQPSQSPSWRSDDPYAAPTQTEWGPGAAPSNVNYSTPGAFLLGISVLNLAYDLLWTVLVAFGAVQDQLDADAVVGFAFFAIWALASIACHTMTFIAGWKMIQRQSLSTAKFGAILGFVPCGMCFLFQIPIAIWAVVVLYSPQATTDFEQ